jgi:hypothetical protein
LEYPDNSIWNTTYATELASTGTLSNCTDFRSYVYVQYACTQSMAVLQSKHNQISLVSCCGVFLVCIYIITIYWFKKVSKLNQLDWDIQTITPGDYTVQMEITDKAYNWFLASEQYQRDKNRGLSVGESLKTYIKTELEKTLTDKLKEMRQDPTVDTSSINIQQVKIADISFAFNNAELIHLLRERGGHIVSQNYDKMREVEAKITEVKN